MPACSSLSLTVESVNYIEFAVLALVLATLQGLRWRLPVQQHCFGRVRQRRARRTAHEGRPTGNYCRGNPIPNTWPPQSNLVLRSYSFTTKLPLVGKVSVPSYRSQGFCLTNLLIVARQNYPEIHWLKTCLHSILGLFKGSDLRARQAIKRIRCVVDVSAFFA